MDGYSQRIKKGDYCELLVLARLVREGYDITIPYGQQTGWDLLVSVNGKWEKWQVKTARRRKPHHKTVAVRLLSVRIIDGGKRINKTYKEGDFDVLVVVDPDLGWMWKVPIERVLGKSTINLMPNSEYRWWNKEPSKFFLS